MKNVAAFMLCMANSVTHAGEMLPHAIMLISRISNLNASQLSVSCSEKVSTSSENCALIIGIVLPWLRRSRLFDDPFCHVRVV